MSDIFGIILGPVGYYGTLLGITINNIHYYNNDDILCVNPNQLACDNSDKDIDMKNWDLYVKKSDYDKVIQGQNSNHLNLQKQIKELEEENKSLITQIDELEKEPIIPQQNQSNIIGCILWYGLGGATIGIPGIIYYRTNIKTRKKVVNIETSNDNSLPLKLLKEKIPSKKNPATTMPAAA